MVYNGQLMVFVIDDIKACNLLLLIAAIEQNHIDYSTKLSLFMYESTTFGPIKTVYGSIHSKIYYMQSYR